jgi:hypothetical protein
VSAGGAEAPEVTFIFPARNEEKTIGEVVEMAKRVAQTFALACEAIVAGNSASSHHRSLGRGSRL